VSQIKNRSLWPSFEILLTRAITFKVLCLGSPSSACLFFSTSGENCNEILLQVHFYTYNKDIRNATVNWPFFFPKGTLFLWCFWPSLNSGLAEYDERLRAVLNTYSSLLACVVVTLAISQMVDKRGKFEAVS